MKYEDFVEKMQNHSTKIVLDTNVILDLARYSLYTTKNILSIFEECKDYIWIPNQVFKEYSKNKYKIFGDLKKDIQNLKMICCLYLMILKEN